MNSLCVSAFARELGALVEQLKYEGHPALARFLPFYSEDTLRQVSQNWETLAGIQQELTALRLSVQQLWYCCVPQTQQQFSLPTAAANLVCSFDLPQSKAPPKKRIRKDRKQPKPLPPPPPLVVCPNYVDVRPFAQEPTLDEQISDSLLEFLRPNVPT